MIGKLSGLIDSIAERQVLLDVNGVGYWVAVSASTLSKLGGVGALISLRIESLFREDGFHLFGFLDSAEQAWFRLLTSVQGVGPKLALAILSILSPSALQLALLRQDKTTLQSVAGVGAKLAARLLTELKDKAPSLSEAENFVSTPAALAAQTLPAAASDALSALMGLGYKRAEAAQALALVEQGASEHGRLDTATLIRLALQKLAARGIA